MISGFKLIHDPNITKTFLSTTEQQNVNSPNYESINYMMYDSQTDSDCDKYENKNSSLMNICKQDNYSYDIRKNKINNQDTGFSAIHSFTGPFFIFIIMQSILAILCFGSVKLLLNKFPNPPKLFTKFIIYIIIINVTIFYFNTLVKKYNLFGLRNILYGNSESCMIIDKNASNLDSYYGDYTKIKSDRYSCITANDIPNSKTTTWKDLFIFSDDPDNNPNKNKDSIMTGLYITIYSLLLFIIIYSCDYLSYWKELPTLKFVGIFITVIIFIIYFVFYNLNSEIDDIKNNKYSVSNPKKYILNYFNYYKKFTDLSVGKDNIPDRYSKIRTLYNAKEFINNILLITILYTIVFLTHKFYD